VRDLKKFISLLLIAVKWHYYLGCEGFERWKVLEWDNVQGFRSGACCKQEEQRNYMFVHNRGWGCCNCAFFTTSSPSVVKCLVSFHHNLRWIVAWIRWYLGCLCNFS
jgi:hypothetical protein